MIMVQNKKTTVIILCYIKHIETVNGLPLENHKKCVTLSVQQQISVIQLLTQ